MTYGKVQWMKANLEILSNPEMPNESKTQKRRIRDLKKQSQISNQSLNMFITTCLNHQNNKKQRTKGKIGSKDE